MQPVLNKAPVLIPRSKSGRIGLSIFFCWQVFAVGMFSIPLTVQSPIIRTLQSWARPIVSPYMYVLSQWQDWRMFLQPDPLQYVKRRSFDLIRGQRRVFSQFLTADESQAVDRDSAHAGPIYLGRFCLAMHARLGDRARLVERLYLDRNHPPMDPAVLSVPGAAMDRSYEWYEYTFLERSCFPSNSR